MSRSTVRMFTGLICLSLVLGICGRSAVHSDPIFVPTEDQSVCEGDLLILIIYADALFADDVLDFVMDGAPEAAVLENLGKCG